MKRIWVGAVVALVAALPAKAEDATVTYKSLAPDVAFEIAHAALDQCRRDGFQVAVVVIDRFGQPLVVLRDRYAGLAAPSTATGKAWTAVNFGRDTAELIKMMRDGQLSAELARLPNVVMLVGGLVVQAGGSRSAAWEWPERRAATKTRPAPGRASRPCRISSTSS